jgi:hypothetical protein
MCAKLLQSLDFGVRKSRMNFWVLTLERPDSDDSSQDRAMLLIGSPRGFFTSFAAMRYLERAWKPCGLAPADWKFSSFFKVTRTAPPPGGPAYRDGDVQIWVLPQEA